MSNSPQASIALALVDLIALADQLAAANRAADAVQLYRDWITTNASPARYVAQFNLGVLLANQNDPAGAEQAYRAALALVPDFVQAHLNLGTVLERLGRPDEALAAWRTALALASPDTPDHAPLRIHALNNLGRLLEIRRDNTGALQMLTDSLTLDPAQPQAIAHWVHLRQKLCAWPAFQPFEGATHADLLDAASALALLAESNDPAVQLAAARRYVERKVLPLQAPLAPSDGYDHARLRIGYLSSDFCNHAVSILTAELYALHDRSKVEVIGFSWSRDDGSALRARVVGAMDRYVRIDAMSDADAARCIREHEIDILVDLHGLTLGTRHDILSWRPAPVQITWLGFPGPTALPAIDYVVADRFVLPEELAPHFTEKPLYLPDCFQINDRQRPIGRRPARAECGLPDDAFVFCSFNSTFKIKPEVFDAWLGILRRSPGSVLWLVADDDSVRTTLRAIAQNAGIDPVRLVFAQRVAPENYLARYQVADLFLDTTPFNAGTTASDALWAGLPVLTWSGATFDARMAGSLLRAVGLPELVTYNLHDYEELAVALAADRTRMAALRARLAANRDASALFDTPRLVRNYEAALASIAKRPAGAARTPANDTPGIAPPPGQLSVQQNSMLALMRPALYSMVEVGGDTLAQAWRARGPRAYHTGIAPVASADGARCAFIASDPEQMDAAAWRQVALAQCWVFPETLERLRDPRTFLRRVRAQALGPVELVICCNNAQHWLAQAQRAAGSPDAPAFPFTRASLAALLQECGFGIVEMTAVNAQQPPSTVLDALGTLASAAGADPVLAAQDALAYQYVVRAVAV
jgi:predicted O-linked N-acetylglucosamine transferase (SPINDLY family)